VGQLTIASQGDTLEGIATRVGERHQGEEVGHRELCETFPVFMDEALCRPVPADNLRCANDSRTKTFQRTDLLHRQHLDGGARFFELFFNDFGYICRGTGICGVGDEDFL
jgi:hypothetical protein